MRVGRLLSGALFLAAATLFGVHLTAATVGNTPLGSQFLVVLISASPFGNGAQRAATNEGLFGVNPNAAIEIVALGPEPAETERVAFFLDGLGNSPDPRALAVDGEARRAWVLNNNWDNGEGEVYGIELNQDDEQGPDVFGSFKRSGEFFTDMVRGGERLFIVAQSHSTPGEIFVHVVDALSLQLRDSITISSGGSDRPGGIARSADGRQLAVAAWNAVSTRSVVYRLKSSLRAVERGETAETCSQQGLSRFGVPKVNDVVFGEENRLLLWNPNCTQLYQFNLEARTQLDDATVLVDESDESSSENPGPQNALTFSKRSSDGGEAYVCQEFARPTDIPHRLAIVNPLAETSRFLDDVPQGVVHVAALTPDQRHLLIVRGPEPRFQSPPFLMVDGYDTRTEDYASDIAQLGTFSGGDPGIAIDAKVVKIEEDGKPTLKGGSSDCHAAPLGGGGSGVANLAHVALLALGVLTLRRLRAARS